MPAFLDYGSEVPYLPGMLESSISKEILGQAEHRPYPLPQGPWALFMRWQDLLFVHWRIPHDALRPRIPPSLDLETFDGSAWLGITPFRMSGTRPRFLPSVPALSDFPELNVRTYVTAGGRPGIWFFSLDAHNPVAVRLARATFGLPYFDAKMSCRVAGEEIHYRSVRTHRGAPPALFAGRYRPVGGPFDASPGTLAHFLTERYCLYTADRRGGIWRGDIHHWPWPLQHAEAEFETLEMTGQIWLRPPDADPILHYARRLDVLAWPPRKVRA